MNKVINFIKYHNAFTIGLGLVLLLTGGVLASEGVRETVIGEKIETVEGVDNSQLLALDLDNFDLAMTIVGVSEDSQNYYIDYSFNTLGIENNVWQPILRQRQMVIGKSALGGEDLGLYVQEELGEIVDNELVYLREVQAAEEEKGQTQIASTTDYTGLIGLVLDIKNKILPGYEPVITEEICDGIDNNRNDQIDEGLGEISCGAGICRVRLAACINGVLQTCTPGIPTTEICDGLDNDCDGQVDENGVCGTEAPPKEEVVLKEIVLEETILPETFINSHPEALTVSTEATFTFYSSVENSTFQCKVNLLDWINCTSPKTYPGLVPGDYTFQVFTTDEQGNYDEIPATFSWTILETEQSSAEEPTPEPEPEATSTEETATSTPETGTSTEPACQPAEEICDGLDNDCDGLIDEDLIVYSGTDEGVCQQGITECTDGQMIKTQAEIGPSEEICDGVDNNCDGQIDEDCEVISESSEDNTTSTTTTTSS